MKRKNKLKKRKHTTDKNKYSSLYQTFCFIIVVYLCLSVFETIFIEHVDNFEFIILCKPHTDGHNEKKQEKFCAIFLGVRFLNMSLIIIEYNCEFLPRQLN